MTNKHINLTPETVQEIQQKRVGNTSAHVHLTEEALLRDLGPSQVESLLAFTVERETEIALEEAEMDNIVYDSLGEHRILGKAKKKKKKKSTPYS